MEIEKIQTDEQLNLINFTLRFNDVKSDIDKKCEELLFENLWNLYD